MNDYFVHDTKYDVIIITKPEFTGSIMYLYFTVVTLAKHSTGTELVVKTKIENWLRLAKTRTGNRKGDDIIILLVRHSIFFPVYIFFNKYFTEILTNS